MDQTPKSPRVTPENFRNVITSISILMIIFGIAEVITGFTHQFFGLSLANYELATIIGTLLGLFYIAAGLLLLTRKTWAADVAIILLCGDIFGRMVMVISGLYPLYSFRQAFGIIAGTVIAVAFAIYIYINRGFFQES